MNWPRLLALAALFIFWACTLGGAYWLVTG